MLGTSRSMLSLSLASSTLFSFSRKGRGFPLLRRSKPPVRVSHAFKPLCTATIPSTATIELTEPDQLKHSILLERLRLRHLKESAKSPQSKTPKDESSSSVVVSGGEDVGTRNKTKKKNKLVESFEKLGLTEEVMGAVKEMNIEVPTEIQCLGIAAVLDGKSVVLGSHTGSGKTLAYLLPLVQLMRQDEALLGKITRPRRPRAVVLCPTRELSEQVYRVAKSIGHHARFRSTLLSGGTRLRPQEDSLNNAVDMVVGTPGRVLQHIEDGNMVYGDIKYVVLDEADTMFDRGFGPDIRKFLAPLKHRASKLNGQDFQTVLVTATMTQAVQKLVDEEFQGIDHLRTSSLHKKIANARHDFIKLSGSENKLEALLQVLEPSLAKGNRVMVFCNTLNSSRAVDHFLAENQISTVNYHGEVPAEQRVENLKKFKTDDGDCPTLVCTDLAARGLDLDVDHVVMFDFPMNSIDYLHRTGRTARMGAKGKVTSLVAKRDILLAGRIEEAIRNNESLESLTKDSVRRDVARTQIMQEKGKTVKLIKEAREKTKAQVAATKPTTMGRKFSVSKRVKVSGPEGSTKTSVKSSRFSGSRTASASSSSRKTAFSGRSKGAESKRTRTVLKPTASSPKKGSRTVSKPTASSPKKESSSRRRESESRRPKTAEKLSVVGFRGRSSSRPT